MKYRISLKGRTYEVEVERGEAMILDEYDSLAPAPAVSAAPAPQAAPAASAAPAQTAAGAAVKAPLPGNVLSVNVNLGDAVKAGQLLVLIEAMKMENEVFAPSEGRGGLHRGYAACHLRWRYG